MQPTSPQTLIFDFGGVLVDLDFGRAFAHWSRCSGVPVHYVEAAFYQGEEYRAHERGELSWQEYAQHLRKTLGHGITDHSLLEGWNAIFLEPLAGIQQTILSLSTKSSLYVLSNTNEAHFEYWSSRYAPLLQHFKALFCSHQLAARKPEPEVYARALSRIGTSADAVVFFDDVQANIEGAKSIGMNAFCVTSARQVREILTSIFAYDFSDFRQS